MRLTLSTRQPSPFLPCFSFAAPVTTRSAAHRGLMVGSRKASSRHRSVSASPRNDSRGRSDTNDTTSSSFTSSLAGEREDKGEVGRVALINLSKKLRDYVLIKNDVFKYFFCIQTSIWKKTFKGDRDSFLRDLDFSIVFCPLPGKATELDHCTHHSIFMIYCNSPEMSSDTIFGRQPSLCSSWLTLNLPWPPLPSGSTTPMPARLTTSGSSDTSRNWERGKEKGRRSRQDTNKKVDQSQYFNYSRRSSSKPLKRLGNIF